MGGLFDSVITPSMAALAAAAVAIMFFLGKIQCRGKQLNTTYFWKNWGDFVLVAICIGGSFTPGVNDIPLSKWGGILIFAFVSALAAHLGRKILKPIFLKKLEGQE